MNTRERLEAVFKKEETDKIPWIPRLKIWYLAHKAQGSLPEEWKGFSLREVEEALNLGSPARDAVLYKEKYHNVELKEETEGNLLRKRIITPLGEVSEVYKINQRAKERGEPFVEGKIEHFIKGVDDYKVMEFFIEHKEYAPAYDEYVAYDKVIGPDGYPMVNCGYDPMFIILHELIGYNRAYYELYDNKKELISLYETFCEKKKELLQLIVDSPATFILHGSHYDSQMTPPPIFDTYILPYLKDFSAKIHEAGKILTIHADADSIALLRSFHESGIDMAESFCTAPMVKCTLEDAIEAWGDEIIIWGGIPSTIICPSLFSLKNFKNYLEEMFDLITSKKCRVILGIADNVMPQADIDRIRIISEMVEERC